jgi:hypothetical protein
MSSRLHNYLSAQCVPILISVSIDSKLALLLKKAELLEVAMSSAEAADRRCNECQEMLEIALSENYALKDKVRRLHLELKEVKSFALASEATYAREEDSMVLAPNNVYRPEIGL